MQKFLCSPILYFFFLVTNQISAQTITVGSISPSACQGGAIAVPYNRSGTFNSGNIFTAQLSDAAGSFASPVNIGSRTATAGGTINATIPLSTQAGTGYRIRIVSTDPVVTSSPNNSDITVNDAPSVTISASPTTVICLGAKVTFTAIPVNGGSNPQYQWMKNYVPVAGATASTYLDSTLQDSDTIVVVMTNNAVSCNIPAKDTSNEIIMIVNQLPPTLPATATPPEICANGSSNLYSGVSSVNFSVSSIAYGNIPVPANASNGPSGDDVVSPDIPLPFSFNFFGNTYSSLRISTNGNIQFGPTYSGSYTPGPLPNTTVLNFAALCWADVVVGSNGNTAGKIRYFTDGVSPRRRFVIDFTDCAFYSGGGSTGSISGQIWLYETTRIVEVHLTQSIGFASTGGGVKTIGVNNFNGSVGAAAPGRNGTAWQTTVPEAWRFTPGEVYTFAWSPAGSLNDSTLERPIASPDTTTTYTVEVDNLNSGCHGTGTVTVTVVPPSTPSITISITSGTNPTCLDYPVTFSSTIQNGGSNPTYQWLKNGVNISGATGSTYTTNSIANNDTIRCILTSNKICVTPSNTATSNNIRMRTKGVAAIVKDTSITGCNSIVYKGVTYYFSTIVRDTIKSSIGCDSVRINATLTVIHITPVTNDTTLSACNGTVTYKGVTYNSSTTLRDTLRSVQGCDSVYNNAYIIVTNITPLAAPTNMRPVNNTSDLDKQIIFSWGVVNNAKTYDFYLWKSTDPVPSNPVVSNLTTINFTYSGSILDYGLSYKWKVVARHDACTTESAILNFTTRFLPDLIVNNIQNPTSAFSGQSISVQWQIKNIGLGGTLNRQWIDHVYISTDAVLDATDDLLGTMSNFSALAPNESYVQNATFTLPQGINNNYFVFVRTNLYNQVSESDNTNNIGNSTSTTFVQLTPPPDLQVTSIVRPSVIFSGDTVNLTYIVKNLGTGSTIVTSWTDYLYLSSDTSSNLSGATYLGSFTRTNALPAGNAYSRTQQVIIPQTISGKHYFFVVTDQFNQVYEHAAEGNNIRRSDSVNIILKPPVDLVVTQITIPATASNKSVIPVGWVTENAGGSGTGNKSWTDNVYLSKSTSFYPDSIIYVGSASNYSNLDPGDFYTPQININVPTGITGDYYVYVITDANNNIFESTFENNNVLRSSGFIKINSPDLVVSSVSIPVQDSSGKTIQVNWKVKNTGDGTLFNSQIIDRISISKKTTYNADSVIEIGRMEYITGQLAKGDSLQRTLQVALPNGISGNYYVYINTDHANAVYEGSKETNNFKRSTSFLKVILAPAPDLVVTSIQLPDSASIGDVLSLSFTVKNAGPGRINNQSWTDRIYLAKTKTWPTQDTIFLRQISQSRSLLKDSIYRVNTSIQIPAFAKDSSRYYVVVFADGLNNIYENPAESNNTQRKDSVFIKKYPPVDLAVTEMTAPATGSSGNPITIFWKVKNISAVPTLYTQWDDALYLSLDTIFNINSDILVKPAQHQGLLTSGDEYTVTQNFVLPNGISGNYFLMLVADHTNLNKDVNRTNNYKLQRSGNNPVPINISLSPPSDLRITSFILPQEGAAGQPVKAKYTIRNFGTGPTNVSSWTDKIYISTDANLDPWDATLDSKTRGVVLNAGQSYTDSMNVILPINASGNYVIILKTDDNDNVYEHLKETNNTFNAYIIINLPPLSDIVVRSITVPPTQVFAGEPITLQWKVKNIGANPANGYMKEAVYLSDDTLKSIDDILIANVDAYINIAPQTELNRSYSGVLTGVSLKDYYVLVHTDVLNNIYESIDSNNVSASAQKLSVNVAELPINVLTQRNLNDKQEVYYRIVIPQALQGESLLISVKGDSANGSNEMYVSFGNVPTKAVYDLSHTQPFQGNQEIIIPALQAGTYYLMITGETSVGNVQQLNILAKKLEFELRKINAEKGGNNGKVTIQINGSKLGNVTSLSLRKGNSNITSHSISIINPTMLYVTFDLLGAGLGKYDVVAVNANGETASLLQGFEVVNGSGQNLLTNVIIPPGTRPNNITSLSVQFTNAGNTDLVDPRVVLSSMAQAPIGFSVTDLQNNATELTLALTEVNGPAGILRPGGSGTIVIYTKASSALSFILTNLK